MISKILLQDWGIYEAWESPDFHHLTVIHGSNASGKSTLQDAITMLFGLCESYYLFKKRKPEEYQRAGQPAFLLAWFENPDLPSGKRRHTQYTDTFTVLCRVDARESPITQYKVYDGRVSLEDAITRSRRGEWLRPKDYDDFWKRAGVTREQRRQRIFKVGDTDRVAASDAAQLHELFREYCSDPELVERQDSMRKRIRATERDLDELQEALARGQKDERATKAAQEQREDLKRDFETLDKQRKLALVAAFLEAERKLKRSEKDATNDEREQARLTRELQKLEPQLAQARKEKAEAEANIEANAEAAAGLEKRLTNAQRGRDVAVIALDELKKGEKRLRDLRASPETKAARLACEQIQEDIQKRSREVGERQTKINELAQNAGALRDHGMPISVHMCLSDLKKHGIVYELARDHLPRDRAQGFEEAIGRARFGIFVGKKDRARALDVMAKHDYPGPLSALDPSEFVQRVGSNVTAGETAFKTTLGEFVVIGEAPFLNEKLVTSTIKSLEKRVAALEKEQHALNREAESLSVKLEKARRELADAEERDALTKRVAQLKKSQKENEETIAEYQAILNLWSGKQAEVARQQALAQGAASRIQQLDSDKREKERRLRELSSGPASQLKKEHDEKLATCHDFIEELRDEADDEKKHSDRVEKLDDRLKDKARPTATEIEELKTQREKLEASNKSLQDKINAHREELTQSQDSLQRLIEEHLAAEEKAFNAIHKNVAELGDRVGCPARVRRRQEGDTWKLIYEVAYRMTDKGPVWQPIKNSSDSTGEGVKASMVFLMGLSRPDQVLFYVFDEPAKNFSPDNDVEMFKILQSTKSQVIISTARALDYGDDVDIQQFFLQAEPRTTPNRKAKPARHDRYRTVTVTA